MERSKLVAIITGTISILLAIAYLLLVQILDFRGEMIPAPVSQLPQVEIFQLENSPGISGYTFKLPVENSGMMG